MRGKNYSPRPFDHHFSWPHILLPWPIKGHIKCIHTSGCLDVFDFTQFLSLKRDFPMPAKLPPILTTHIYNWKYGKENKSSSLGRFPEKTFLINKTPLASCPTSMVEQCYPKGENPIYRGSVKSSFLQLYILSCSHPTLPLSLPLFTPEMNLTPLCQISHANEGNKNLPFFMALVDKRTRRRGEKGVKTCSTIRRALGKCRFHAYPVEFDPFLPFPAFHLFSIAGCSKDICQS